MSKKSDEYLAALSDEDEKNLIAALNVWKESGVKNPRIPIGEDLTDDGIVDSWGLSKEGGLIVVPSVGVKRTVYKATGEGLEVGETE